MKISEYIGGIKEFYHILLIFLEKPDINEQDYQNLFEIIKQKKYEEDRYEFKNFVQLLVSISENHHYDAIFSPKIEKILLHFAQAAKRFFSNPEIFSLCKSSKRILQLFIEKNIIEIDQNIANEIISMDYCHFFYFEIENFIEAEFKNGLLAKEPSFSHNFYEKRKKGENESYICSLIRNDLVEEFISYVNKTNYPLSSEIEKSIFETNSFLFDRKTTLIEYSAFFGSIQIFQYLKMNNVELKSSLWLYAIHSNNPELIHLLEANEVEAPNQKYEECFFESIKCHHNDIARYIEDNFLQDKDDKSLKDRTIVCALKYHNFLYFPSEFNVNGDFYYLCCNNYYTIVNIIIGMKEKEIKATIIQNKKKYSYEIFISIFLFKVSN